MNKSLIILFLILYSGSFAQKNEHLRNENFNLEFNIAISGYDPVSYFTKKPVKGNSKIAYVEKGVIYYFKDEMNRAYFISDPKKYEPAYGGWCAYAMGLDDPEKVGINPKTYKIINNKLYLFYNKFGINTLDKWNKNEATLKSKADENWDKIILE